MAKQELVRQSLYRNDRVEMFFDGQEIKDSPERIFACYEACRGLNPEHVGELVLMVKHLSGTLDYIAENYGLSSGAVDSIKFSVGRARELLAKSKA